MALPLLQASDMDPVRNNFQHRSAKKAEFIFNFKYDLKM